MKLGNGAKRIFDVIDRESGESDFLACVSLQVEVANGNPPLTRIDVDSDHDDDSSIVLSGGHL